MGRGERVLVTGGSGFLGAGLTRALVAGGADVHLVVRSPETAWRLAGLDERCRIHRADLLDGDSLRRAVACCRPDVVYHLAAYGVHPAESDRATLEAVNVRGTANLLEALRVVDYRALVHVGSGAEYGPRHGPVAEDEPPRPQTDYARAKAAASGLCLAEAARGRPVVVVRVFSAYGPWERPTRLPSYVMGCCLRGEVPRVSGGEQRRDFIAAADVWELLQRAARLPRPAGTVLHAGTGTAVSVRDVVRTVLSVCGREDLRVDFGAVPLRPNEPPDYVASVGQTRQKTGWAPRFDLRAGVEDLWAWYRAAAAPRAA